MIGFEAFLRENSWLGFLAYIVWKEAWPFLRDRVWPQRVAKENAERERLTKLEDRAAKIDERQTNAQESMSLAVQQMALAIATNNERLTTLITGHNEHDRFTREAVGDMRDRVAAFHPATSVMKIKARGKK